MWRELPASEQVSDDFGLYTDGTLYAAVRADSEGDCSFVIKNKSLWIAISDAVERIHQHLDNLPENRPSPYWDNETQLVKWQ